jgi:hypothetical protein
MQREPPDASYLLPLAFVCVAFFGIIHSVLGGGRSVAAYALGAIVLLACVALMLLVIVVVGWAVARITNWFQR